MKYKFLVIIYNSRQDRAGNCYWAFRLVDNETGKQVEANFAGNSSNILAMMREFTGLPHGEFNYVYVEKEMPVRQFEAYTHGWLYAGCNPTEIADFIRANLNRNENPRDKH